MYTDCPNCRRQFRIRAEQLGAAGGWVQCGFCGQRYNALGRLRDRPLSVEALGDFGRAGAGDGSAVEGPVAEEADSDGLYGAGMDGSPDVTPPPPNSATAAPEGEAGASAGPDGEPDWAVPPELLDAEAASGRRGAYRWLWSSLLLALLLLGAGQLAWFNRDRLLTEYPQLSPLAEKVCGYLHCELIRHRDLSAIQVVNRDVRDHPRYRDALLVNATIVNNAGAVQPFPVVRLSLYDTAGKLIAYRRFQPGDYLDASVDRDRGMQPRQPVHIVLELSGPSQGAVSFEFDFLPG